MRIGLVTDGLPALSFEELLRTAADLKIDRAQRAQATRVDLFELVDVDDRGHALTVADGRRAGKRARADYGRVARYFASHAR